MRTIVLTIALLLGLGFAACDSDFKCTDDYDCPEAEVCTKSGSCERFVCEVAEDCDGDLICEDNACKSPDASAE